MSGITPPPRRRAGKRVQYSLYDDVQTIHIIRRAEANHRGKPGKQHAPPFQSCGGDHQDEHFHLHLALMRVSIAGRTCYVGSHYDIVCELRRLHVVQDQQ